MTRPNRFKDFYKKAGKLAEVDGIGSVTEITDRVMKALEENA